MLPPVPNNMPDDTDIPAKYPGQILPPDGPGDEVVPPDDPGDTVELPVDVPAGLNKSTVYIRCGRAVRRPVKFE